MIHRNHAVRSAPRRAADAIAPDPIWVNEPGFQLASTLRALAWRRPETMHDELPAVSADDGIITVLIGAASP